MNSSSGQVLAGKYRLDERGYALDDAGNIRVNDGFSVEEQKPVKVILFSPKVSAEEADRLVRYYEMCGFRILQRGASQQQTYAILPFVEDVLVESTYDNWASGRRAERVISPPPPVQPRPPIVPVTNTASRRDPVNTSRPVIIVASLVIGLIVMFVAFTKIRDYLNPATLTPTLTATFTATPTNTATPLPTGTATFTSTPLPTFTWTPVPSPTETMTITPDLFLTPVK